MDDLFRLTVGGRVYSGWMAGHVHRAIDRMASSFEFTLSERWLGETDPWQIQPFAAATVHIGDDLVLTGYVDTFQASYAAHAHEVRITGRSKTADLIDSTPDLPGGQFANSTLEQIARAICTPYGIDVVVQADVGDAFPDATIERHETGYTFLERLARLRAVLLTDDPQGRLVITTAGAAQASGALTQGRNILRAGAELNGTHRFSEYRIKVQAGVERAFPGVAPHTGPLPAAPDPTTSVATQQAAARALADAEDVPQTQATTITAGIAYDPGVPRYRPRAIIAETGLDAAGAQRRALWQAKYNAARGTQAHIDVQGYRQTEGGALWQINQIATVTSAWLQLDMPLLVAGVTYEIGSQGRITRLECGPVEGYQPDPGQVRVRKGKGGAKSWDGVASISSAAP